MIKQDEYFEVPKYLHSRLVDLLILGLSLPYNQANINKVTKEDKVKDKMLIDAISLYRGEKMKFNLLEQEKDYIEIK